MSCTENINIMVAQRDICIVVVLYNPSTEQIKNVEYLSSHFSVAAVDNSEVVSEVNCSFYSPLLSNKGIAVAQNVGIKYARENGYKYVLLLDQDSKLDDNFIQNLYADFLTIKENDPYVGFIGPVFVDEVSKQEYKNYSDKNKPYTRASALIASGCLISMECLDAVGGMDESLFIDLVDFEWCWRAESKGFNGYMTRNVKMTHSIGKEYHNWHGFVLGISAPFRYFYQYRNTLWLCKRDYVPFRWKVKSILRRTLDLLLVPLVSKEGIKCFKFMTKGIKMGLFYKNTPLYQLYD